MSKLPLLLLGILLGACACGVLHGQSFDLGAGREPIASLDGLWRFHPGDDPAWANSGFDDSKWPLLRSDMDWSSQGYRNMSGMAWYRFQILVPSGMDRLSIYLPEINTCFEVYADGKLIGTYGKMPPNTHPYGDGFHGHSYPLPDVQGNARRIEIALRIWHWPGFVKYYGGGPENGGGRVGTTNEIDQLVAFVRDRKLWSLETTWFWELITTLVGFAVLTLFLLRRKEFEYLWFSLYMLLLSLESCITLSSELQVWNVETRDLLTGIVGAGFNLCFIFFFQQLIKPRRTWLLKVAVGSALVLLLNSLFGSLSDNMFGVWFNALVLGLLTLPVNGWAFVVVLEAVRRKSPDARLILAPVALMTANIFYAQIAWATYALGWQQKFAGDPILTHRPFLIQLGDVTFALFLLAVFGALILRFTRTASLEERFASEVQAAREVQQYLIPSHLPETPGFHIEGEYRPAREVGGDFFQVLPNPANGSVLVVLGDVAGKGLEAGMLATLIVGAIRTAAAFTDDPSRIMALLNDRLQGRGLVTCLSLRIDSHGSAVLVNAGHLPPYLNEREMPMEGALPLGAIPGVEFSVMHFQLAEGDSLMLMSDGVAEAQDAKGHLFGFERIGSLLRESATAASLAIAAQNFGQEDDITVLTVARLVPAMIG